MSKIFKVLDDSNRPVKHESTVSNTDWKKCFICQEEITETVRCPANSINKTEGAGYCTIAENLLGFDNIGSLPSALSLSRLDEGGGLEDTLRRNRAVYHDSCRLQYNTSKLKRAEKRRYSDRENVTFPQEKFIRKTATNAPSNKLCVFCDQEGGDSLHDVSTFQLDVRVRKCALQIQDQHLLAKLGTSDLIAQEAKYHVKCLISLYNRAREKSNDSSTDTVHHGIAFASVVAYIEVIRMDSSIAPVFKMTDLVRFYNKRLMELSIHVSSPVHTTRLKARILAYFPDLVEQRQGRDIVLISNTDVAHALQKACKYDSDDDGILLVRAAEIVRRDMLKTKNKQFNGNFGSNCQETSVPSSLLSLVSMILNGPNFQTHTPESDKSVQQAALSIAQLLMFNSSVRHRKTTSTSDFRHTMHRETPLPIYLGMMLYTRTRKKELVDILFDLGLSVSCDRVLSISTDMGNRICEHYDTTDVVCPPQLKGGIFTTSAIDNIDHNPSSTTAQDSFQGTGISLFQHPSYENEGLIRLIGPSGSSYKPGKAKVALLPESYTNVPPVEVHKQQQLVPVLEGPNRAECHLISQAMDIENGWLNHLAHMVASDVEGDQTERASWAAFHAGRESHHLQLEHGTSISALLPLFHDQAKSVAMIRHSMNVVKSAVQILNEMQVPIITVDQPLYAVAKQIQWTWPESHGEDEFIVMFGGLHIEMAALKYCKTVDGQMPLFRLILHLLELHIRFCEPPM